MREILLLCTKNVHFTSGDLVYLQTDGVAMGSPLGPVLAGILMVDLERSLVPLVTAELSFWRRYVDDTITFVKIGTVDHILSMLNNFDPNIQFTYETEYNFKLAFLDVMLLEMEKILSQQSIEKKPMLMCILIGTRLHLIAGNEGL